MPALTMKTIFFCGVKAPLISATASATCGSSNGNSSYWLVCFFSIVSLGCAILADLYGRATHSRALAAGLPAQKQNPQTCLSTPLLRHLIHTLYAYQTASKHFDNVD
jgi:hypothetical protein